MDRVAFTNTHCLKFLQKHPEHLQYAFIDEDDGDVMWRTQGAWRAYLLWMLDNDHIDVETYKHALEKLNADLDASRD
jgi:hypothetical protein